MTFAASLPWTTYPYVDRSLGTEAAGLRLLLEDAASPASDAALPASIGRTRDIFMRLVEALTEAARTDGITVSLYSLNKTLDFIQSLSPEIPLPAVVVESDDEIGLDWDEGPESIVSLTIDTSDRIGFAALLGSEPLYGRAECIAGLPDEIRDALAHLYPSAPLR